MTEEEAKARCTQLAAEHPDRERNQWLPVKAKDGTWSVARIGVPPPLDPTATTESHDSSRPAADDPSSELDRSIRNFFYGG